MAGHVARCLSLEVLPVLLCLFLVLGVLVLLSGCSGSGTRFLEPVIKWDHELDPVLFAEIEKNAIYPDQCAFP